MRGTFTCVRWQVTLCDPIWQVIWQFLYIFTHNSSSAMTFPYRAIHTPLTLSDQQISVTVYRHSCNARLPLVPALNSSGTVSFSETSDSSMVPTFSGVDDETEASVALTKL